jgi:hypothetical protein
MLLLVMLLLWGCATMGKCQVAISLEGHVSARPSSKGSMRQRRGLVSRMPQAFECLPFRIFGPVVFFWP